MEKTLSGEKRVGQGLHEAQVITALVVVEQGNGNASARDVIDALGCLGATIEAGQQMCFQLCDRELITITPRWTLEITDNGRQLVTERHETTALAEKMGCAANIIR